MSNDSSKRQSVALGRALIPIKEARMTLSVGKTKLYELAGKGEILLVKVQRLSRIDVESIDEYLKRLRGSRPDGPGPTTA